ncbi:AAA family ATPase [Comamonas suwonensis]|uniref:AAA family ATPase n=1 Tax=Comamonas suwonensis TaxID=2606214 RepID=UPI00145F7C00|nr:AAA family ATPase [Comamonas suwonensis]MBI1625149.1 AAA family ATPase [Comamonas suwonensis]
MTDLSLLQPTRTVSVRDVFGIDTDMTVPAFAERTEHVPAIDKAYRLNPQVTQAILAGFAHNRRVVIQGLHGTGKSTHIEQVAARLNWPCVRVNLDGHISRLDLVGKDTIVLQEGKQVTQFQEGILPWSLQRPVAIVFDEYDAGRPDVMFVIQRVLEREGSFTMLDQKRVIQPHPYFRLFATMNTLGQGNLNGLYHGTQLLNHAQLDRWNLVTSLNYLAPAEEAAIVMARVPEMDTPQGRKRVDAMVALAGLTRRGFSVGDLSLLMSPRTVITWAENISIFNDLKLAFELSFLNKCEPAERAIVSEYFQRCFGQELARIEEPALAFLHEH